MRRNQGNIFSAEKRKNTLKKKKTLYKHYSELFKTETHILERYIYLLVSVEE